MATYTIFRPLVRISRSQQTGDGGSRIAAAEKPKTQKPTWNKPVPLYKTESDVTTAIANGTFKGYSNEAYRLAKEYEKYLRLLAQWEKGFVPNKAKPVPNGKYNHCLFPSR